MLKGFIFIVVFCAVQGYKIPRRLQQENSCGPPKGELCVEIRKCPFFAELLDKTPIPRPRRVIDIIRAHHCGFHGNSPKVCCSTLMPQNLKTPQKSENQVPDVSNHPNLRLLPTENCGTIINDFRITSGAKTGVKEFPWMALLAYLTKAGIEFRCGGSLINDEYILTAAHCVESQELIGVRLGEHDIQTDKDCDIHGEYCAPPVQDFYIEDVIVHPDYKTSSFSNDIAIIKLATKVNLTYDNVKPICLPIGDLSDLDLDGKFAVIAGWGVTETGYKSPVLLKTSVPVVPNDECSRIYEGYQTSIDFKQLCAGGYLGRDSCAGDSGGPLKYVTSLAGTPKYVQYGIVSFGPKYCGIGTQPGVYTRISYFLKWILDNLKPPEKQS
ncbi:CLIP domain-containing serine protease 2 [Agrilus planipennis]|uniref:CLIP domain-containing serine protease n=1 Tax=Agrilus planipennis TaxID=224129 RepID=A0A7F5RCQ7_AGRPL|nr:CLIP domain-containing serine protease 2 [Agrilus planipennis]